MNLEEKITSGITDGDKNWGGGGLRDQNCVEKHLAIGARTVHHHLRGSHVWGGAVDLVLQAF